MTKRITGALAVATALLASTTFDAPAQTTVTNIHIDPRGAYLRLCPAYTAFNPTIIDLQALAIAPGDLLRLTSLGEFKFGINDPHARDAWRI